MEAQRFEVFGATCICCDRVIDPAAGERFQVWVIDGKISFEHIGHALLDNPYSEKRPEFVCNSMGNAPRYSEREKFGGSYI